MFAKFFMYESKVNNLTYYFLVFFFKFFFIVLFLLTDEVTNTKS